MPGAWHPSVAGGALPGGILLAEQQVLSASPRSQHSHIDDFVSHPNAKDQRPAAQAGPLHRLVRLGS